MSQPDASAPGLGPRVAAFAALALLLTVAVYGAYSGFAPGATINETPAAKSLGFGGSRATQPGSTVAFYLALPGGEPGGIVKAAVAESAGLTLRFDPATRDASGNATLPVYVTIPEEMAPGKRLFAVTADGRLHTLVLNVLPKSTEVPADGTRMLVDFVLRDGDGRLFSTTVPDLAHSNLPKHSSFFPPDRFSPRNRDQGDDNFGPALVNEALDAMVPGETRTVFIPAGEGFPEWVPAEETDREETYGNSFKIQRTTTARAAAVAPSLKTTASALENASIGTVYQVTVYGVTIPHKLTAKEGKNVTLVVDAEEGATFTRTEFLAPGATTGRPVSIPGFPADTTRLTLTDTEAIFTTTAPTDVAFTARAGWEGMSRVVNVASDRFTIRHDPPVGHVWTEGNLEYRVAAGEDAVVKWEAKDLNNPLAGKALIVDLARHAPPS